MTTEKLAQYIPQDIGLPIAQAPFNFNGAKLSVFVLECDVASSQRQLDKYINSVDGSKNYRAISVPGSELSYIFLVMADMQFTASNQQGQTFGKIKYPECSFWIPAVDINSLQVAMFLPLLLLDNATAIASGREVYGFEKQQAQFDFYDAAAASTAQLNVKKPNFQVNPYSFTTLSPDTIGQYNPLLKVAPLATSADKTEQHFDELAAEAESLLQAVSTHLFPGEFAVHDSDHRVSLTDFVKSGIPLPGVFLKQFPSVSDTDQSCFQQLAKANFRLTAIHGGAPYWSLFPLGLTKHQITVFPIASHPLVEQFGLKAKQQDDGSFTMQAKGLWLDVDFSLELGN